MSILPKVIYRFNAIPIKNFNDFFCRDRKKIPSWGFLHGPVVKTLPSNSGNEGSIPGQGTKIPHATGQPSPSTKVKTQCSLNKISK